MAPDKLAVNDPRVQHHNISARGRNYHFIMGKPQDQQSKGTVLLIHGFPDLGFGWRYQVPHLLSLGYQVIVPDALGYGRSDAPDAVEFYSIKSMCADMNELLDKVLPPGAKIILGGHDWGGHFVWRFAEYHPDRLIAVFSVCTPYIPPTPVYIDLDRMVEILPNFRYQLQFAGPKIVEKTAAGGQPVIRKVLDAMYGARDEEGNLAINVDSGIDFDRIGKLGQTPLLSQEELDFYVDEFSRHGFRGPTNWYRNRKVNFDEEQGDLLKKKQAGFKIPAPAMFIVATKDEALPESMSRGMEAHFESLTRRSVEASHWALWQTPVEVNGYITEFLDRVTKTQASL